MCVCVYFMHVLVSTCVCACGSVHMCVCVYFYACIRAFVCVYDYIVDNAKWLQLRFHLIELSCSHIRIYYLISVYIVRYECVHVRTLCT